MDVFLPALNINRAPTGSGFGPAEGSRASRRNISETERLVSTMGGAALIANSLAGRLRPISLLAGSALLYRGWSGHCTAYKALGINSAHPGSGSGRAATAVSTGTGVKIERSIAIQRPARELFEFWRKLENLPRAMSHLESVTASDDGKSHWVALGPFGKRVEWDAEVHQEGDDFIAWRSLPGSDIDTAGSVHFRSLGENRGTAVDVSLKYNPPGGRIAAQVLELLGQGLEDRLENDLREFKSLMEAGETPTVEGQAHGSRE
jgi:uncharacterized membrane protein